ncbi:hypothetical protein [Bacteroides oleiciplenus]|uniref:Uncharacterized protein n=2 Tax=Bacteroides oleiciplenus TaxID=626931 RepID=K9DSQ0_9BACE|nr:hypothetical protein [Bacteroides oleiciplenus]EKU87448.1 hypothetical protein HMPREF9447_05331 [Bacteroides oleiciplenus YIT 12058]RGN32998.1 hypothetical protein DXB65_17405 [Bacteroides oleiciplenus]
MKLYYGERRTRKKELVQEHENDSCEDIADAATEEAADTVSADAEPVEENENIQATSEKNLGRTPPLLELLKRKLETFMDETM